MMPRAPFGRIVRYVSHKREIVPGLVTGPAPEPGGDENRVNLHLFRDGPAQAHLPIWIEGVPFAPVHPTLGAAAHSWHWTPA